MVCELIFHMPCMRPKKKDYLSETMENSTKFLMTSREAKGKKRKKKSPVVYFSGNQKGLRSSTLDLRVQPSENIIQNINVQMKKELDVYHTDF